MAKKSVSKKATSKKAKAKKAASRKIASKKAKAKKASSKRTISKKVKAKKTASKKTTSRKAKAKKTAPKKATSKKTKVKKVAAKKATSRKAKAKKVASKKVASKKAKAKKVTSKKAASNKAKTKKAASRKVASKKTKARKAASKKAASKKAKTKKAASRKVASKKTKARKAASKKAASKKAKAKKTASRKVASKKAKARKAASKKVTSKKAKAKKTASRKVASKKAKARKAASKKATTRKVKAKKLASNKVKTKKSSSKKTTTKKAKGQKSAPKNVASKKVKAKKVTTKRTTSKNARTQKVTPAKPTSQQAGVKRSTTTDEQHEKVVAENAATENAATENAAIENAATENVATENVATENTAIDNAATENTAIENSGTENVATENVATENAATENTAIENVTPVNALAKNVAPENTKETAEEANCGCPGPGYASPQDAIKAPREQVVYTICIYTGTAIQKPDYLATIDVDPDSDTYGEVISRCDVGAIGDELHHMGWNACSSCNQDGSMSRNYLIVPGVRTSNFYIIDTATDPRNPTLFKTISGDEIKEKTNLSAPHTVHCLGSEIIVSMLGDASGKGPGGFLHLNKEFEIVGRWENDITGMNYNYDFWYQPRHNMMVSTEWASPNTFMPGFDLADVADGKYGRHIHFWDFEQRKIEKSVDLGDEGLIPLEVRFHHDPDSTHGFVGATLSSNIHHWYKDDNGEVVIEKVIDVEPINVDNFPVPMPGLITDILISMDDKYLYFSNWLHGDLRQYDISDPSNPKLTGQLFLGGLLGKAPVVNDIEIHGAPQMIQLSLDGKRLYVTTSLFSTWDNQFYPDIKDKGGQMFIVDCDTQNGGIELRENFLIDFGKEPNGPARAHETRYPGGDCSSDIWV